MNRLNASAILISTPKTKSHLVLWFGLLLGFAYLFFLNPYLDVRGFNQHDPVAYLNRAISIWHGTGYGVQFADRFLPVTIHAPGFSLLLAPIVGLFGINFLALKLYMVFLAVLFSISLVYFFKHFLVDSYQARISALIVMSCPVIFGLSHRVLSDIPLFLCITLALVCLDSSLKKLSSWLDFSLFMAALATIVAYSFKITALGVVAGGWFLWIHPDLRNRRVFFKLLIYTLIVFIPIFLWQHWTTTVGDEWYWTHPAKDFFLKEPFKPDGSYTTIAEFIVRIRRNIVYGMTSNLVSILIAPFYFFEGELIGFVLGFPFMLWFAWQWAKSYWKEPSVLEGFVVFSFLLLLLKYHGFANRYVALIFPAAVVYAIRGMRSLPSKILSYCFAVILFVSLITTALLAIDQQRDPYGSEVMRDYVAIAEKARKLLPQGSECIAPLGSHWQVLTDHKCFYSLKGVTVKKLQSVPFAYLVVLNRNLPGDIETLWNEGRIRHIDRDALKDGLEFRRLVDENPLAFEKIFENSTFALHKVKSVKT